MVENYDKENGETARFCVMINKYMESTKVAPVNISNVVETAVCVPVSIIIYCKLVILCDLFLL